MRNTAFAVILAAGVWAAYYLGTHQASSPLENLTHHDDPIIIDNPSAFISLLPEDPTLEVYLSPPVDSVFSPRRSYARLWGHSEYKFIRLTGTNYDSRDAVPLASSEIGIAFTDANNSDDPAGTLLLEWTGIPETKVGVVNFDSTDADDSNGRLRWKRAKVKITDNTYRRGLVARASQDYRIATVTYKTGTETVVAKKNQDAVKVELCVKSSCQ